VGDEAAPEGLIADAAAIARREIAENRAGAGWIDDPLYVRPEQRTTVTGKLELPDGRPVEGFRILLSTQDVEDVYTIHEPTYFVKTDANGRFRLPGLPPAWKPGTTEPGTYTLYAFAGQGSVTDQYKQTGIVVEGHTRNLGTITWTPGDHGTFLWQIGRSDRTGGEYALATHPVERLHPRDYDKPSRVPGDLTFTVGESWEPTDWYYAQTNPGTWTIAFTLDRSYTGTAALTVSTSLQQGSAPTVAVNGSTDGITGTLPDNDGHDGNQLGGTMGRQADRSGYRRVATLTFPASQLRTGVNTITLSRGGTIPAGNGLGWDTFVLTVDEPVAPAAARLRAEVVGLSGTPEAATWTVRVTNRGRGAANDVRLTGVRRQGRWGATAPIPVSGRDPGRFPVPVSAALAPGASTEIGFTTDLTGTAGDVVIGFSANGGRATATATGGRSWWPWRSRG
jgi:rhamnogalacturonan endolyase